MIIVTLMIPNRRTQGGVNGLDFYATQFLPSPVCFPLCQRRQVLNSYCTAALICSLLMVLPTVEENTVSAISTHPSRNLYSTKALHVFPWSTIVAWYIRSRGSARLSNNVASLLKTMCLNSTSSIPYNLYVLFPSPNIHYPSLVPFQISVLSKTIFRASKLSRADPPAIRLLGM
jgi:hypothetical protein